jgi:hypothetical protein
MNIRVAAFVFFATALLFSMVREWSAPPACPRMEIHERANR